VVLDESMSRREISMSEAPLEIVGVHGSPYSRKMRAVLRYRHIAHRWIVHLSKEDRDIPEVPVALIPVLVFPGAEGSPKEAMIDSTFQIRRLEESWRERSLIPPDPVIALLDFLIEDFADEWLTKAMFHYRWAFDVDAAKAAAILPRWSRTDAPEEAVQKASRVFCERQVGRLAVVGSNESTAPVIEASYRRLLRALDAHLREWPFVAGARPGTADFGLFGQLSQLALFDPTSAAIAMEESPRVVAWCHGVEDLSGLEVSDADWLTRDAVPETLLALLAEVGRAYAPFLLANAAAIERGEDRVECEIDGRTWVQKPFPYQAKCLRWLREARADLAPGDRGAADALLAGTGCEILFAGV
jgi:glutathione S-transferase